MALSSNLNRRGAAARTERRDTLEYLEAVAVQEIQRKARQIETLMGECIKIEGDVFITWWDEELPARIPQNEQLRLLEDRLRTTGAAASLMLRAQEFETAGNHEMAKDLRDAIKKIQ